jgi:hypothetical protein
MTFIFIVVPLDDQGAPDLQLFVRACGTHGGYRHVGPDDKRKNPACTSREHAGLKHCERNT